MTLEQCTKKELIFIINHISSGRKSALVTLLQSVEQKRIQGRIEWSNKYFAIALENRERMAKILEPYKGQNICNIPTEILLEAADCEKRLNEALKKSSKLMD